MIGRLSRSLYVGSRTEYLLFLDMITPCFDVVY
jgi:hypothetical protein